MATAASVVDNALEALGVQNELNPPDEFLQDRFFKALIRLINRWSAADIDVGITIPTVPADELGNPESIEDALITSLAIDGQTIAKVATSNALKKAQKKYYAQMKAAFGLWPEQAFGRNMPFGQGNNFGPRTKRFFPEPNTIGADDSTSLGV